MNRIWAGGGLVEVTAANDGRSHRVEVSAYDVGLSSGTRRYRTVCGSVVLAAALVTAPGPLCRACRDVGEVDTR